MGEILSTWHRAPSVPPHKPAPAPAKHRSPRCLDALLPPEKEADSAGKRLYAIHQSLDDEPLPERMEEASCGPAAKHLAHLALRAAEAGGTPEDWRGWITEQVPEVSPTLLAEAEECMRDSGLWPWN
jgi:hypothetical protein